MNLEWLEKIKEILGPALTAPRSLLSLVRKQSKVIFIGLGGLVLVFAVIFAAAVLARSGGDKKTPGEEISGSLAPRAVPVEELFLPGEPDFLPGVILERERRESWTVEDALPYWTDPLEGEGIPSVNRIRGAVDTIMERVP